VKIPPPEQRLRATHQVDQSISYSMGSVERAVYYYTTERSKAYMHPLRLADGTIVTAFEPADHPWHRGLWFSWKYLNGINFWEESESGASEGHTVFAGTDASTQDDAGVHMATRYEYRTPKNAVLLHERRAVDLRPLAEGVLAIDWHCSFTAASVVHFDRTAFAPETPWGGYAGFSFRASERWQDVHGLDSEGRVDLQIQHQRARWVQISGVGEHGHSGGVAILDHPENPRYPTHWYYSISTGPLAFTLLNPALLLQQSLDLSAGEQLDLRYRLLLLDDPLSAQELDRRHAEFLER
jgi:hypothetical protein